MSFLPPPNTRAHHIFNTEESIPSIQVSVANDGTFAALSALIQFKHFSGKSSAQQQ